MYRVIRYRNKGTRIIRIGHHTYLIVISVRCRCITRSDLHTELQPFHTIYRQCRESEVVVIILRSLTEIEGLIARTTCSYIGVIRCLSAQRCAIRQITGAGRIALEVFYIWEVLFSTQGLEDLSLTPLTDTRLLRTYGLNIYIVNRVVSQIINQLTRGRFDSAIEDISRSGIRISQLNGTDLQVPCACLRFSPRNLSRNRVYIGYLDIQYLLALRDLLYLDIIDVHVERCAGRVGTTQFGTPISRIIDTESDTTTVDIRRKIQVELFPVFCLREFEVLHVREGTISIHDSYLNSAATTARCRECGGITSVETHRQFSEVSIYLRQNQQCIFIFRCIHVECIRCRIVTIGMVNVIVRGTRTSCCSGRCSRLTVLHVVIIIRRSTAIVIAYHVTPRKCIERSRTVLKAVEICCKWQRCFLAIGPEHRAYPYSITIRLRGLYIRIILG